MKDKLLIAVDAGKYQTKAIAKYRGMTYLTTFRTKLRQVNDLGVDMQSNSYLVTYNNKDYLLGDMVSENHVDYSLSKSSLLHQLAIYTAIAQLIKKTQASKNVEINLAITVPIHTFKDAVQKEGFQRMVCNNDDPVELSVNNDTYALAINNLVLTFEGIGEIFTTMEKIRDKNTIVVDIGGLNTTLCTFKGINPQLDTMVISNLGINVLKNRIGKALNDRYGQSISSDDLELIIRNGYFANRGNIYKDSRDIINDIKYEHFQQIIQFALANGYTFNMSDIHVVGGGSIILREYIKDEFPNAIIFNNPQYSNCQSSLKILEVKHG